MCITKGNPSFHRLVGQDIIKKLTEMAMKHCKKVNQAARKFETTYDTYYFAYLPKFMKTWGELLTFIDGAKSNFFLCCEQLKKANIDFDTDPSEYAAATNEFRDVPQQNQRHSKINIEELISQSQDAFQFASQMDPETWTNDRETADQIYRQVHDLSKKVTIALAQSEQNPEMDLTVLLDINTKLTSLQTLIAKAVKGDRESAERIVQMNDLNAAGIFRAKF